MNSFQKSLALGKSSEHEIAKALSASLNPDTKGVDLLRQIRIEVKLDIMSHTTGNIAIENSYKGETSILLTNKYDLVVILAAKKKGEKESSTYLLDRITLMDIIKKAPQVKAGDGKNSMISLVPIETIQKASLHNLLLTLTDA